MGNYLRGSISEDLRSELVDRSNVPSKFSNIKVEWKCDSGHTWWATPGSRSQGSGCPKCWDARRAEVRASSQAKNNPLSPELRSQLVADEELSAGSGKRVRWRCDEGHEWIATPANRTRGSGCPVCNGPAYAHVRTPLENELYNELVEKQPLSSGSGRVVEWECQKGHRWFATPSDRTLKKTGCKVCMGLGSSAGERELADFVESLGYEIIRNDRSKVKPLELDIYIPEKNLAIEYNGSYWHSMADVIQRDLRKAKLCRSLGIHLVTVWDYEWLRPDSRSQIEKLLEAFGA